MYQFMHNKKYQYKYIQFQADFLTVYTYAIVY